MSLSNLTEQTGARAARYALAGSRSRRTALPSVSEEQRHGANVKTNKLILFFITNAITRTYCTRCHQLSARTAHKGG